MSLVPHDPIEKLNKIRHEFDRLFSEFLVPISIEPRFGKIQVDVHETEEEVIAICDVPGVEKKEDIHISVDHNRLIISGQVNQDKEIHEDDLFTKERFAGEFYRMVTLPSPISERDIKATYKNGVLNIRMKKVKENRKSAIDIEFES